MPRLDAVRGFIIRAQSPIAARVIAAGAHENEGQHVWEDPTKSTCHELDESGSVGIIARERDRD